ncbi:MAG: DNA polymerase IV [Candidatus Ancillula sp.]|nr:DNA polymerase IV [Candidatus Ancillula sp.]
MTQKSSILHIDMNAFYASCEQARKPQLRGLPVVVGMDISRSVVSAASYEAREYGIHSAMPIFRAKELCKNAIFLPVDMDYYVSISQKIHKILQSITYQVEKVGLDEFFLDVSGAQKIFGEPREIALKIRSRILQELSINSSVGIAISKSVAKIASGFAKPASKSGKTDGYGAVDNILVIESEKTLDFIHPLDISKIPGVGRSTARNLKQLGIQKVADILLVSPRTLAKAVGNAHSENLIRLANGLDINEVMHKAAPAKSIGRERTLREDTRDKRLLYDYLLWAAQIISQELREVEMTAKTITLKLKTTDFISCTRSKTLDIGTDTALMLYENSCALLDTWLSQDSRKIRLIGISTAKFAPFNIEGQKISLLDADASTEKMRAAEVTMDKIRAKLGNNKIIHLGK